MEWETKEKICSLALFLSDVTFIFGGVNFPLPLPLFHVPSHFIAVL